MTRRPGQSACVGSRRTSPATAAPITSASAARATGVMTWPRWRLTWAWTTFALAGESGGAPFTLTVAHRLADRVSVVALIASGGPVGPAERAGQKARNKVMGWLARNAPALNTVQVAALPAKLS